MEVSHYKICFYVPIEECETVKQALFAAGAGRLGHYDCVAWQTQGKGQFRPLEGAQPAIGEADTLSYVDEFKVELCCDSAHLDAALAALKQAHPYEMPAIDVWPLLDAFNLPT